MKIKFSKVYALIAIALSALAGKAYMADSSAGLPLAISEIFYGIAACNISTPVATTVPTGPPYIIAIDPGHGGMDTGAQALVEEYQVIDTTTKYLAELLEADRGFIPVITRTDSDPSSAHRADIARRSGAALLISIHANSDSSSSSHGFECFPAPPGRTFHRESLQLAQLIAREMKKAGHALRGGENKTGIKYAYYYGSSKKIVDSSDTQIRSRQSFGILEKSPCPAVLVEQCFITNANDVESWATDRGCRRSAEIYYAAIRSFLGTAP